ncbi:MAG: hypothetical protein A2075_16075 [Geobacteraceae bacterium GWC2_58_44]|nr:MAG: hypothetical protein A2075_16075 [Geobacteraceae bacterium GWC2_58_44]
MFNLQPFDCLEYLFDLIGFCLPFGILYVYSWVARPRSLIDAVTSTCLTGWPEIMITYPAEIGKTSASRITAHFL